MSQTTEAISSSLKTKRPYRKGTPLSLAERKQLSVSRKKETHKELNVFIQNEHKDNLRVLCEEAGVTQAQMIETWIECAVASRNETLKECD